MRKGVGQNRRTTPGADSLENRYLLSVYLESAPPPALSTIVTGMGPSAPVHPLLFTTSTQETDSQPVVLVVEQAGLRPAFPFGVDHAVGFAPSASGFGYSQSEGPQPSGFGMDHAEAVDAPGAGLGLGRVEGQPSFRFATENEEGGPSSPLHSARVRLGRVGSGDGLRANCLLVDVR